MTIIPEVRPISNFYGIEVRRVEASAFCTLIYFLLVSAGFVFGTCEQKGFLGPSQEDCDQAYNGSGTKVRIGQEEEGEEEEEEEARGDPTTLGYTSGIQRWTVPATDIYP